MHRRLLLVGVLVVVVGCAPEPTDPMAFGSAFDAVRDDLPTLEALDSGAVDEACEDALTLLRTARAELPTAPSDSAANAVEQWFEIAEGTFFECPPSGGDLDSFEDAYDTLDALGDEIDALESTP